MRRYRWLLFPLTLLWFGAVFYWANGRLPLRRPEADRGTAGVVSIPVAALSPDSVRKAATRSTIDRLEVDSATTSAPIDSLLFQPCILPCVKNRSTPPMNADAERYVAAMLHYCAVHARGVFRLTGHTDADGSAALNTRLSLERAEALRELLITRGCPAARLVARGAGAEHPISDNITSEGKALNRRITIELDTTLVR